MFVQNIEYQQSILRQQKGTFYMIRQGNRGGPAMWISHLTVMFAALSSVFWGFAVTCIQQLQQVTTVGAGYVDDVTLGFSISKDQSQTENTAQRQIQQMGQL